jgi:predicted HD phosphohydrolase
MTLDELVKDLRSAHDHADKEMQTWGKILRVASGYRLSDAAMHYTQAVAAAEIASAAQAWVACSYHDVGDLDLPTARLLVRTLIAKLAQR